MKKVLFTLILSLALQSCDWIKSLGPEETFFCKINGQKFRPEKDVGWGGSGSLEASWNKDDETLFIYSRNSPQVITLILFFDSKKPSKKEFNLFPDSLSSKGYYLHDGRYSIPFPENMISQSGKAAITKVDGYYISGTFEFVCKDSTNNKEYRITEGEFNKLSYY
ncbi:hypothetical protein LAG90_14950 [Marinilongibacter aquaticus]|uniref:DUF6252 family protein n=1 Tax=Marinilongibacter aquaticus TaxID=2975157 RepID=UPI0021BDD788|nr:DUF6252 family protein [Marinilongibacter aquaticus]UBM58102.1 hypothetical protein LAG90_14950 [Marinilongibacter aquaticus]